MCNVDSRKKLKCLENPEWIKAISSLKNFNYDHSKKYNVKYREGSQRNDRRFLVHAVEFNDGKEMVTLIEFKDEYSGNLTSEIKKEKELSIYDITGFDLENKPDPKGYSGLGSWGSKKT